MARRSLTVQLEGRGSLKLGESNYVATGGEGSIYRAHETVVKIYTDPAKMVRDGMAEKIGLLKALHHPTIVAPQGLVRDKAGATIGFYMPWVAGEPLARVFTTAYRTRSGFSDTDERTLVERMRETVAAAHAGSALMIDANELNWLVQPSTGSGPEPRVIDVDSWSIGQWPATVIMPSIHDWHSPQFGPLTDWFAWAVITFQVWTGIHPYQGRAPNYKPGEIERRMKDNVSVFAPDVHLPAVVRDFARIPSNLFDWYRAVFHEQQRCVPPRDFDRGGYSSAAVLRMTVAATGNLKFERLFTLPQPITQIWACGLARLADGDLVNLSTRPERLLSNFATDGEVVRISEGWLCASCTHAPQFTWVNERWQAYPVSCGLRCTRIFRAYERLFAVTEHELVELDLHALAKPLLTSERRWNILVNATEWFENVAVMDLLGSATLLLPTRDGAMHQIRCPELDQLTVLAARAGERFVSILGLDRSGQYQKIELTFTADYAHYTVWHGQADQPELNLTILPNGVVATVVRDGELTIFVPANGQIRQVQDRGLNTATALFHWGQRVVILRGAEVWQVSVAVA